MATLTVTAGVPYRYEFSVPAGYLPNATFRMRFLGKTFYRTTGSGTYRGTSGSGSPSYVDINVPFLTVQQDELLFPVRESPCAEATAEFSYQISAQSIPTISISGRTPPGRVVFESGTISVTFPPVAVGDSPCENGQPPPAPAVPPTRPTNTDNPYSPPTITVPLVLDPQPPEGQEGPEDPCLPPAFVQPAPAISTPCDTVSNGSTASGGFQKLS